jgi:hypothetical protein
VCFDRNIYHGHEIDENIINQVTLFGMHTKIIIPILGAMTLFMKAHKCMFIVMQLGLATLMIVNSH